MLRLTACSIGAAAPLGAVLWFIDPPSATLLVASSGRTVVFLFGLTRARAVQPRALFGGRLSGALIGIACFQMLGDATWVYLLAVVTTLVFMLLTGTVHPPAGAKSGDHDSLACRFRRAVESGWPQRHRAGIGSRRLESGHAGSSSLSVQLDQCTNECCEVGVNSLYADLREDGRERRKTSRQHRPVEPVERSYQ